VVNFRVPRPVQFSRAVDSSGRRGRTALSVITAGTTGGAILVGIAFAIDALNSDSHAPSFEMATYAPTLQPGAPNLV
jgi:hypothetical protein